MKHKTDYPKIGLALGSGGARGLSIAGILGVLEEEGIEIDYIAGTSIGSLLGGFYASGITVKEMRDIILNTKWKTLFSLLDPKLDQGLMSGKKVQKFLQDYLGEMRFEDCKISCSVVCTNVKTGECVIFDKGSMARAIRASISIPLVFKPVEIEGMTLVDGMISKPVPVDVVRRMGADVVIAVNLDNHYLRNEGYLGFSGLADNSMAIMRYHLARLCSEGADVVVSPEIGRTHWHQFTEGKRLIRAGEEAMREKMPELKKILRKKATESSVKSILNKKLF